MTLEQTLSGLVWGLDLKIPRYVYCDKTGFWYELIGKTFDEKFIVKTQPHYIYPIKILPKELTELSCFQGYNEECDSLPWHKK